MEKDNGSHKATNCGLQHWMIKKFENLGWMCLSQKHGHTLNIDSYFESIRLLIVSLEIKILEVKEKDRKDDLKITLEKTKILDCYACDLLMGENDKNTNNMIMSSKTKKTKKSKILSK